MPSIGKRPLRAPPGAVIDSDIIQRAKDFERDWAAAIERWAALFKANAGGFIGLIDAIIRRAGGLASGLEDYARRTLANEDLKNNRISGASRDTLRYVREEAARTNMDVHPSALRRLAELEEADRESRRGSGFARTRTRAEAEAEARAAAAARKTDTSSQFGGGSRAGGSGNADTERVTSVERYITGLRRATRQG